MRDLVVLTIILGSVPVCLINPYYGVLMWTWIAYFNPHRYTWGIAYNFPVAQAIAVPTLLGTLFARRMNRHFLTREAILLLLLWVWFCFTMFYATQVPAFAGHIADGMEQFKGVSKILLMTIPTILLVSSKEKVKYLVLVIAFSFGVRAFFGALFEFRTNGQFRVYGPEDSFIADNNAFGLALNMALPMLFFLAREEKNRLLRKALYATFGCTIICVIFTYSRGALLGLAVVLALLAIKTRRKLLSIFMLLAAGLMVISYAPEKWMTRMSGFLSGEVDGSAKQRLVTWEFGWNFAKNYPFTGGGFQTFPDVDLFQRYALEELPGGFKSSGPHSVYFQVLGEHGFLGLGLYLSLLACSLSRLRRLRKHIRHETSAQWVVPYSHMMETSLLGFMTSGAFLGFAYFDLYFQVIACVIVLTILYRRDSLIVTQATLTEAPERSGALVGA